MEKLDSGLIYSPYIPVMIGSTMVGSMPRSFFLTDRKKRCVKFDGCLMC